MSQVGSRVGTACLETVCASLSKAITRCHPGGSPNEHVWLGLQWSPPDVTIRGSYVWCPGAWVWGWGKGAQVWCWKGGGQGWEGSYTVISNVSWVMVTYISPVDRMTERHDWKHCPPATSLLGDENGEWTEQVSCFGENIQYGDNLLHCHSEAVLCVRVNFLTGWQYNYSRIDYHTCCKCCGCAHYYMALNPASRKQSHVQTRKKQGSAKTFCPGMRNHNFY